MRPESLPAEIARNVAAALAEDLGGENAAQDWTAALVPAQQAARARVIARESAVVCGQPWFDACFRRLDGEATIRWWVGEGAAVEPGTSLCEIQGQARALLTAERSALNFLQLLCGVASTTRRYAERIAHTHARVCDTRKTLPGLRVAQKYAVSVGGGLNHRVGLFDGVLIKENHIAAAGGIAPVLRRAREVAPPEVGIEIEVESLAQLQEALAEGAGLVLLDNFSVERLAEAVALNRQSAAPAVLEASGGITLANIAAVAETGVDRISIGALTKDVRAIDLSMRFLD
ncbi:MAG: carboxylating nicotinate-nucleotide diphosphorylase [Burkholderiales bacterium]|nr:MAG: carboxylating nicotinate-nucleotide diphosphorylase [Burkholderiales bacterium]